MQPSVASTARALVLHDPAFLSLPKAAYDLAATRLETHPRLPALEAALATAITTDPSTPLDADAHPEIYNIAVEIAASLLSGIVEIDETAVGSRSGLQLLAATDPVTGAVPVDSIRPVLRLAAADPTPFVEVIDDPEHSTPEVRLVNTTFAYYTVTYTLTTPQGTSTKTLLLPRCALWQLDFASLEMSLPPVGCKLEKLVDVGDGQLTFSVRRNDDYTAIDAAANTITLLLGAGGEAIRKMAGGGSDLAALSKTGGAILQISKELGAWRAGCRGRPTPAPPRRSGHTSQ